MDGLFIGNVRFYVVSNICVLDQGNCECEAMTEQLNAQLMGWA